MATKAQYGTLWLLKSYCVVKVMFSSVFGVLLQYIQLLRCVGGCQGYSTIGCCSVVGGFKGVDMWLLRCCCVFKVMLRSGFSVLLRSVIGVRTVARVLHCDC